MAVFAMEGIEIAIKVAAMNRCHVFQNLVARIPEHCTKT